MQYPIIGTCARTVDAVDNWLESKGCPRYAGLYAAAGTKYGVDWSLAVFQSCLETGFWSFRGDVQPNQNNFAGIGATGGGVPGESFDTPALGIMAQIQHLATYAGIDIPVDELTAARTKLVKQWIIGVAPTWPQLAGRWAADDRYWAKILAIATEFDEWAANHNAPGHWVDLFADGKAYLMRGSAAVDMVDTGRLVDKLPIITDAFGSKAGT
jgi:hypothetical protein